MSDDNKTEKPEEIPQSPLREIVQPFIDFARAPRALWGVNLAYVLEGFVYFGMLGYLAMYFNDYVGLSDTQASPFVGFLTVGITVAMVVLGGRSDKLGPRRALLVALVCMLVGRAIIASGTYLGLTSGIWGSLHFMTMFGILFIIVGYGLFQPAAYGAVRVFTTPKTAAMGYAMLYALMNLGGWLPSFFSPVRKAVGINGAYVVYTGITVLAVVLTFFILTSKTVKEAIAKAKEETPGEAGEKKKEETRETAKEPFSLGKWLKAHPLADLKFTFFIFALIPVQTLFAHNWLTLPQYTDRAFRPPVNEEVCADIEESTEARSAFEAAKNKGIDDIVAFVDANDGTRAACEGRAQIRGLSLTEPEEGKALDKETLLQVEGARQAIRNYDHQVAMAQAKKDGDISRQLSLWIGANFEAAVNFNPLLIFILVPIVAAVTRKRKVYNMMIIGTLVMAAPTFFLVFGPSFWSLGGYLVVMTIGEAMWQPRFLQYAAEIAPEGRTGAYIGVAQIPWFLTKAIVPAYSGWFLENFCPKDGAMNTETMWLIYACIAVSSTVLLILAKGWVGASIKNQSN